MSEIANRWILSIDHVQVTAPPELEDAVLFLYGKVLGLQEVIKPENLKGNGGVWYALRDIQIHVSTEKQPNNQASRRHICFRVRDLNSFEEYLKAHGVEIISDQNPIPGWNRFYIRDPGGNRIEIIE